MAESVKPAPKAPTTPAPAPPVEAAPAPVAPPQPPSKAEIAMRKFKKALSAFLTTTTWLVFGLGLIALGFLEHFYRFSRHLPKDLDLILGHLRLPYLFVGLGLFALAQARGYIYREYALEVKKNKKSTQAWKLPLVGAQIFFLYISSIYFLLVGFQKVAPAKNLVTLTFLLFLGIGYVVWYGIGWLKSHFHSIAALRISMFALIAGAMAYGAWAFPHQILLSLILGFYALILALASLAITASGSQEQRGNAVRMICLIGTGIFVYIVGTNALPYGRRSADLRGMGLATGDLQGEVGLIAYGPKIYSQTGREKTVQKVAFSLKAKEGWFLEIIDPENQETPTAKIAAGEGTFRPFFVNNGRSIILDPVQGGSRSLWKVNIETGAKEVLKKSGLEPFGDGVPWQAEKRQFLFVTQEDGVYRLNLWSEAKDSVRTLMKSEHPILTPSFTFSGDQVAYADGTTGLFRVLDLANGQSDFVLSQEERSEQLKGDGPPVTEVIPAPDGFRYLYVTEKDGKASLWEVLSDGSKRKKIYTPSGTLRNIAWTPDGQKIVFEERKRQLGTFGESPNILILDANLETSETLIPPQLSHRSPAVSPDGVKVAFAASQGLWYPFSGTGIWVAVLR